jgi:hypothetical protein
MHPKLAHRPNAMFWCFKSITLFECATVFKNHLIQIILLLFLCNPTFNVKCRLVLTQGAALQCFFLCNWNCTLLRAQRKSAITQLTKMRHSMRVLYKHTFFTLHTPFFYYPHICFHMQNAIKAVARTRLPYDNGLNILFNKFLVPGSNCIWVEVDVWGWIHFKLN